MSEFNPKRFETVSNAADRTDAEKAQIIDDLTANLQAFEADRYEEYLQENQSEADFEAAMAQRAEHEAEAENDQKFALEQQVLAEPKLRQMYMMAQQINGLRTKVGTDPSAEFIIADKESKLAELMDTYAADAQADKDMTYTNAEDERRSTKKRMQDEADQALEAKMAALNFIIDQTDTNEAPASIDTESTTPDTPDNKEVEVDTPQNTENPEQEVNQVNPSVEQADPAGKDESQEGDQKAQIAETGKTQSSAEKSVDEAEEEPDTYEILGDRMVAGRKLTRVRIQRNTPDGRVVRSVKEFDDEQFEKYFANQGIELPALESEDEPEETSEPVESEQGQDGPDKEEEAAEEAPAAQTAPVVVLPPVSNTFTGHAERPFTPSVSAATPQTPASPTSGPEVTGPVLTGTESQGEPNSAEAQSRKVEELVDAKVAAYRQAVRTGNERTRNAIRDQVRTYFGHYLEGNAERAAAEILPAKFDQIDIEEAAQSWYTDSRFSQSGTEQAGGQEARTGSFWQELGAAWKTDRFEGIMDVVNDEMGPEWSAAPAERRKGHERESRLGRAARWLGIIRDDGRSERTDAEAADDQAQSDETNVVTTNR